MDAVSPQLMAETADSAQGLLGRRYGGTLRIRNGSNFQASGRSNLFRFEILHGPSEAPRSVIVKRAIVPMRERFDPRAPHGPSRALFNEWAGLEFLSSLPDAQGLAPRWEGGDLDLGLVVMEDIGDCPRLDHMLLGTEAPAAQAALVRMAAALGRMHGLTANRGGDYERLRSSLGPRPEAISPESTCAGLKRTLANLAANFGVTCSPDVLSDVDCLQALFRPDHPYWTYTHGDPCPDNWLLADSGIRLIDFESATYGNALLDGVYGRIHFPTCWCARRIPTSVVEHMDDAYRREFGTHVTAALDDELYSRTRVEACALHALKTFGQFLSRHDLLWGIATMQQRAVLRSALLRELTEKHGHLESLGRLCGMLGIRLSAMQIGQRSAQMPYYPAFRDFAAS
jgi:hypothetical protein